MAGAGSFVKHMGDAGSGALQGLSGQYMRLPAKDILLYYRFQSSVHPLSYCTTIFKHAITSNPVQIYINQVHQKLTPDFRLVFDKYWSKFASDASDAINAIGVVPYTTLVTHDGFAVPHVLVPGTYDLNWRHNVYSEGLVFHVTRTEASGVSFFSSHAQGGDAFDSSGDVNSNQMAALMNGEQNLLGAATKTDTLSAKITGPTAGDPHELLTRRMDMGRSVPSLGRPDPSCMVLSGFGTDPSIDGHINSNAAALWPEYIKLMMNEHMYATQEDRLTGHVPFAEVPEPSDAYVQSLTMDTVGPTTLTQALGDRGGIQQVMLPQQDISRREALRQAQRDANARRRNASLQLPILEDMLRMQPAESYEALYSYMRQTHMDSVGEHILGQYELLQPGAHLSSYSPTVSSKHLMEFIKLFNQKTSAQFQIPIAAITERTSTQGDTTQQREAKYDAVHWMIKTVSGIMTQIYRALYTDSDVYDAVRYLHARFLSKDAIDRLMRDFDRATAYGALQQTLRVERMVESTGNYVSVHNNPAWVMGGGVDMDVELEKLAATKRKNKGGRNASKSKRTAKTNDDVDDRSDSSDSDEGEEDESVRDSGKRTTKRRTDIISVKDVESDSSGRYAATGANAAMDTNEDATFMERRIEWIERWLNNPNDIKLLNDSLREIVLEPDYELARMRLRMMYYNRLRRLSGDQARQLLEDGDTNQRAWYSKHSARIKSKAQDMNDIQVSLVYSAPIDMNQLTFMAMMGLVNSHEYVMTARSRYMLPVQCDTKAAQQQTHMLDQMREYLLSSEVQKLLSDTPMGMMMKAIEGQLAGQQQQLQSENEQLHKQLEQEQMGRQVDRAVERAVRQVEKKAENGEKVKSPSSGGSNGGSSSSSSNSSASKSKSTTSSSSSSSPSSSSSTKSPSPSSTLSSSFASKSEKKAGSVLSKTS